MKIKYRKVNPNIWNDEKFRLFSRDGKLVFFMLLTHPQLTAVGAMRHTIQGMAAEMDMTAKDFRKAFEEPFGKGMVRYDERACFIWLPNFIVHNPPESPNVVRAWAGAFHLLPECDMKNEVYRHVKDYVKGLTKGFQKAFAEAFVNLRAKNKKQKTDTKDPSVEPDEPDEPDEPGPPPPAPKINNYPFKEIISSLNKEAGRSFRHTATETQTKIKARFNDKFTLSDFLVVNEYKSAEWKDDAKMYKFLRPETLYGTKFEGYLQEALTEKPKVKSSQGKSQTEKNIEVGAEWLREEGVI